MLLDVGVKGLDGERRASYHDNDEEKEFEWRRCVLSVTNPRRSTSHNNTRVLPTLPYSTTTLYKLYSILF